MNSNDILLISRIRIAFVLVGGYPHWPEAADAVLLRKLRSSFKQYAYDQFIKIFIS